ncbi:MAG: TOBE domain-containing protein, partial [Geminicoccaceae bacterium]|nr:TOBE domain-containing protein [Geminicoccaceae bacterium]
MTLADRIVVLSAGIVQQFGSPLDLYHHPQNRFVAGFIGSPKMNFLPVELLAARDGTSHVKLPDGQTMTIAVDAKGAALGNGYELGVRPEHLLAGGGGDAQVEGPLVTLEHLGAETYVYADLGLNQELPFVAKAAGNAHAEPGQTVRIGIPAGACYLFDKEERAYPRQAYY